ncbi:MAG: hypothetical protein PWP24_291 [Clostridiales bacterium]|nr:hypothetical protein [Clostridiales bacterium]
MVLAILNYSVVYNPNSGIEKDKESGEEGYETVKKERVHIAAKIVYRVIANFEAVRKKDIGNLRESHRSFFLAVYPSSGIFLKKREERHPFFLFL